MPAKLDRCVRHVKGQGKSTRSAFRICNASLGRKKRRRRKRR